MMDKRSRPVRTPMDCMAMAEVTVLQHLPLEAVLRHKWWYSLCASQKLL